MPVITDIYYTFSDGEFKKFKIILIHGAGSNRLCWHTSLRRLFGYQVIAIDLPGHGNSKDGIGFHSIQDYSDRVIEFLFKSETYQSILVGHSMGGAIAMNIALHFPQLIAGLCLISTGANFNFSHHFLDTMKNPSTTQAALEELEKRGFSKCASSSIVNQIMRGLRQVRSGVLLGDWNACANFDIKNEIKNISVPTWISVGADDQLTPISCSRYLAHQISNAKLHIIPDAGHMVILEKPQEINQGILQFLQSQRVKYQQ